MPDITSEFVIRAPRDAVFRAVSTPEGLDSWWTERCSGTPLPGELYRLDFGPGFCWQARVSRAADSTEFELQIADADADWTGTSVGFLLEPAAEGTRVRFHHRGWRESNEHYRVSCFCWHMYLRLLRRYVETGESVAYADRANA